jgi:mycothiol synthase
MTITACAYTEADRGTLRDFLLRLRQSGAPGCWHVGDLAWSVFFLAAISVDLGAELRLWKDETGRLVGFAWFDPRDCFVLMQAWPGADNGDIQRQMLAWAEGRRAELPRGDAPSALRANAFENDPAQMAFLESLGFQRLPGYLHFTRPLFELPPTPASEGFVVRAVAGEHEIAERATAHREVFQPSRVTEAQYRRLVRMPEYCRELDIVAAEPGGRMAAFCLCWLDPVNKVGEFEPVGTRPAYRRRGLGRAVLFEGLRRMQARGMETAFVCTQHDNAAAQALYRAAGFDLTNIDFDYVRGGPVGSPAAADG